MKIVFFPQSCLPFHARTLEERPLGGMETAIIRLAEALHLRGHKVAVFTADPNPPPSQPEYLPLQAVQRLTPVDVFVAVREWIPLAWRLPCKKRFFWTGDAADQPQSLGIGDLRLTKIIDGVWLKSRWQAETLCRSSGLPRERVGLLGNGVHLPYFEGAEQRVRKRLIYSSTPYRGLGHMLQLYPEIKRRHPDAELKVFSGYAVYQSPRGYDAEAEKRFEALKQKLAEMPDVEVAGNVLQKQLAREYMKAAVLVYPNVFAETSCITAMEAQAGGCVPVTTALGALPETIGDSGVLISARPGSAEYAAAFVDGVDRLLKDDRYFEGLSAKGRERSRAMGWSSVAARLEEHLKSAHGIE